MKNRGSDRITAASFADQMRKKVMTAADISEIAQFVGESENAFTPDEFQTSILDVAKSVLGRFKTAFYRKPNGQVANLPAAGGRGPGFIPVFG
jgi:hypothetical protein